jgi:hypothetical protein
MPSADSVPAETADLETAVRWDVSRVGLTSFIGFEVEAQVGDQRHRLRFTLNLPISGLPEDREDHIFCAILSNQGQFLRYLRVLLAERDDPVVWAEAFRGGSDGSGDGSGWADEAPLLKELVRALSRSPGKIDHIAQVVERLNSTSEGRAVLPEDFQRLWEAVIEARSELE